MLSLHTIEKIIHLQQFHFPYWQATLITHHSIYGGMKSMYICAIYKLEDEVCNLL